MLDLVRRKFAQSRRRGAVADIARLCADHAELMGLFRRLHADDPRREVVADAVSAASRAYRRALEGVQPSRRPVRPAPRTRLVKRSAARARSRRSPRRATRRLASKSDSSGSSGDGPPRRTLTGAAA